MILIENTVISDSVFEEYFVCDLAKCKGACCIEGDLGAPLEKSELTEIETILEDIKPYLSEESLEFIRKKGATQEISDEFVTPTLPTGECVYAFYDDKKMLKCAFEQAYFAGKTSFRKPISCHLYPIRITKYDEFEAINYHQWSICQSACEKGIAQKIPLYQFLKQPLLRKYGEKWYRELEKEIEERLK